MADPSMCEHANENPGTFCHCPIDCYCRQPGNTCCEAADPEARMLARKRVLVKLYKTLRDAEAYVRSLEELAQ